jgi:radical SAM-linked protein
MKKEFFLAEMDKSLSAEDSPSCLETLCGRCKGCDFISEVEKEFHRNIVVREPPKAFLGRKTETGFRYQAFYSKRGPARFISHNDLINMIQRSFRRSAVNVLYSGGFHPKMLMSLVPALPLGMEGNEESFEFKSFYDLDEKEFVSRMNENVPPGIRFLGLAKLEHSAPSITERIESMVYSLNLNSARTRKALETARQEKNIPGDDGEAAGRLIQDYLRSPSEFIKEMSIDKKAGKVILHNRFTFQKSVRAQDIVEQIFNIEDAVYDMSREKIIFK